MKILVSGSHGMVGSVLVPSLSAAGHQVLRLIRPSSSASRSSEPTVSWDPASGQIDRAGLEGLDAVVHLAGDNIATGRWTAAKKAAIRQSRVASTHLLAESLAGVRQPPSVLLCASAIGYYGSRGDELLREDSRPGAGFLAETGQAWEAAAQPAADRGIRVASLRFGMILSAAGGALAKMLPPFRLGVGGVIGDGRQYWSWIGFGDVVGVIEHVLTTERLNGPVNAVAPRAVTNREFTHTLGRVLHRPTIFPVPAFAARLAFGEMADELLLASTRVEPTKLVATHYAYRDPELDGALRRYVTPTPASGR